MGKDSKLETVESNDGQTIEDIHTKDKIAGIHFADSIPMYCSDLDSLNNIVSSAVSLNDMVQKVREYLKSLSKFDDFQEAKMQMQVFLDYLYMNNFNLNLFHFGNKKDIEVHIAFDDPETQPQNPAEILSTSTANHELSQISLVSEMICLGCDMGFIAALAEYLEDHSYLFETPTDPYPTLGQDTAFSDTE